MPHLSMEHSANLAARTDMTAVCRAARQAMMDSGLFEIGAVRVRAHACEHYAIADEQPDNAFLDMVIRIGAGRSAEDKKRLGGMVFEAVAEALRPLFETPHFALSLEVLEIDSELSWKKNAMHARLRERT